MSHNTRERTRRNFLAYFSAAGLSSTLFPGVLWARLQAAKSAKVSVEMMRGAAELAGLDFTDADYEKMAEGLNRNLERYEEIRQTPLDNSVPLALHFNPLVPGMVLDRRAKPFRPSRPNEVRRPADLEELAFWPVLHLAELVRTRKVRAAELTELYLARLKKHNPKINCVVTLTEERARREAERADGEIAAGRYRGPLHGIPWGVKDIIAAKGYGTTWGAAPFKEQVVDEDATVVERLSAAGAVLVAKLTTGELAFGDNWFGGRTNNPWNPEEGSSGSSAGSGAATAAGLVGFAIGTDTGGSILSPSARCGVVGLRPTFGRVSRYGAMNAGFSLDKIGPMCRTVEDCALVLRAIAGPDGKDLAVVQDLPFNWDAGLKLENVRVGYYAAGFAAQKDEEQKANDTLALEALRALGFDLRPLEFPQSTLNFFIEFVERAAGFDAFTRGRKYEELRRRQHGAELRTSRLVPAVEYLQANRLRMLLMQEVARVMAQVDVVVAPRTSPDPLTSLNPLTSLTGHPVVAVPNGFTSRGTPTGMTFVGQLFREAELLAVAKAYQDACGFHLRRPPL
jgi:Asp-tRNA(Asn)/Glu-tRNA(Gln) amidotransferase A subunit family amidase